MIKIMLSPSLKFRAYDSKLSIMSSNKSIIDIAPYAQLGLPITQWTGLTDQDNTDIYVGDIIRYAIIKGETKPMILKVIYSEHNLAFDSCPIDAQGSFCPSLTAIRLGKIIGNVFENPELDTESKS